MKHRGIKIATGYGAAATIVAMTALTTVWSAQSAEDLGHFGENPRQWVAAWQGSPTVGGTIDPSCPSDVGVNNQTVRNIIIASTGGDRVRVRLSNVGGSAPLRVGAASVAISAGGAAIVGGTSRVLRFGGKTTTVIAAEGEALSDPVKLDVEAFKTLAVSIFLPDSTGPATQHFLANQDNYVAAGNQSQVGAAAPYTQTVSCWMFLSGLVVTPKLNVRGTLVTLGDSITDGYASTKNGNNRYPDDLARRLAALPGRTLSVSNAAIDGNDLLANRVGLALFGIPAPARLARDVLTQAGVRAVILLEGINDIGANAAVASDLIQIDQQIITQAHAAGLKIYGGTLVPFGGSNAIYGGNYGSTFGEQQRQALNQWIRTSAAFDGIVEFDIATRDPKNPTQMLPAYDSGDHLHPGPAGYQAMANAVDIGLIVKESLEQF
jgi:lysophospholipase L1-like esterase